MVSKESLFLIAVLIVLVIAFMYWSNEQSSEIQATVSDQIDEILIV